MNWVKANKFLTGFIIVMLIGMGILGYEVYAASGAYDESLNTYTGQATEYNRLRHLIPFPSKPNLEKFEDQKKGAADVITAFQVDLAKNEFPLVPLTPEQFQVLLKETVVNVKKKASDSSVKLPDKFFLSFDKYETTLPSPEAAAPLGRQLKAIEWIVNQYIEHSVLEISSLVREELPEEKGGRSERDRARGGESRPGPRGGGGAGAKGAGASARRDLVHYHSFDIAAICKQGALDGVLNAITGPKAPQFYVLRQIRIRNQKEKGPAKSTPSPADPNKPKDTEYIAGEESIGAEARIDIVDFTAPTEPLAETEKAAPTVKKP